MALLSLVSIVAPGTNRGGSWESGATDPRLEVRPKYALGLCNLTRANDNRISNLFKSNIDLLETENKQIHCA